MGGEGTEALLDTLLVADICENIFINSQFRMVKGRNVKAGLSH